MAREALKYERLPLRDLVILLVVLALFAVALVVSVSRFLIRMALGRE